jgi:hypothetical protein
LSGSAAFASTDIGQWNQNLAIKPARSQQGWIKDILPVGGGYYNHMVIDLEAVHFNQQLVQGLLTFVVAASPAAPRTAMTAHCVNLVDKDDAGRFLLALFKEVADP